ncbi:chloride channel protein [Mycolicibacterium sp. YH-1]|uniref:chloride channel protein n=1 Tax=Mycolicibacterium sp. YH-1 TaxID=2908837 RepID=UPI001F4C32CC|nr:chloride channel protein [Mycolicibacterium sp. YH-1]UNB54275.1 chloride channel protein [Mycolicibacterium sp. YH-1]HET7743022.1 chloride channel protein [Mycobacterium sp.]
MSRRAVEYSCAVVVIGLLAGAAGAATTLLLHAVEHLTYHYSFGTLLTGVGDSSPVRRAVGPMIGCALAGLGWWALRRRADVPSLSSTIAEHRPIPRLRMSIDAGLQVLLVGAGASLGREGAPRQLAASFGDLGISRLSLTPRDREILLACAAGAGLGAVYSVPLGGALFAARILLGTWHPRALGTALITSSLAVAVASPVTHFEHSLTWPDPSLSYLFVFLALAIAPLSVAVGLSFDRLMSMARPKPQIRSWTLVPAIAFAGLATGVCSIWWPELPGNGRSILTVSVNASLTLGGAAVLLALKPLLTALFLRAGAIGGMITPALATGAAAGSLATLTLNHLAGTDIQVAAVSLTCAAGVLAVTQRAPVWAALFVWELARPPVWLLLVFAVAAATAHVIRVARERRQVALSDSATAEP